MSLFRTKVVEFFGLPRTGKTTTAEALVQSLVQESRYVRVIRERASLCPVKDKMSPLFNYWTALSQLKEYIGACDQGVELLVADRGVLDSAVWLRYKNRHGKYHEIVRNFRNLFDNRFMNQNTLLAVYFTADLGLILERERHRRLKPGLGTVMNPEVLSGYSAAYRAMKDELESMVPIFEVDTTQLDIHTTLSLVCEQVQLALGTKTTGASSEPSLR